MAKEYQTGHAKIGGIKKGQKKRTTEMVHRIFDIIEKDFYDEDADISMFEADILKMSPKDRREVYLKLLKTVMPTMSSFAIEDNTTVSSIRQLMENIASYKRTE